jgi:hypothetical protein
MTAKGHAVAEGVNRRVSPMAAWVLARFKACGICCRQGETGAGFLQVIRFPLLIFHSAIPPQS